MTRIGESPAPKRREYGCDNLGDLKETRRNQHKSRSFCQLCDARKYSCRRHEIFLLDWLSRSRRAMSDVLVCADPEIREEATAFVSRLGARPHKNTRQGVWIIGRWPSQIVPATRHSAPRTGLLGCAYSSAKSRSGPSCQMQRPTAATIVITAPGATPIRRFSHCKVAVLLVQSWNCSSTIDSLGPGSN